MLHGARFDLDCTLRTTQRLANSSNWYGMSSAVADRAPTTRDNQNLVCSVGGVAPATLAHEEPKIVLLAVTGSEGKNAGGDHLERSERRRVGG